MQKLSDDQLFALIKKSDIEAFKELYYRYFDQLYTFALLHANSSEDIKDVIQEIFYQLWKKRKFIFIRRSLKAYLYRMVHNFIINTQKKNSKIRYFDNIDIKTRHIDTKDQLDQKIDIEIAIKKLPEKIRAVYILKTINDLSNKEIARVMNISIKTVEARTTEAYKKLRIYLNRVL